MKVIIMPRERAVHGILTLSIRQCVLIGVALLGAALCAGGALQRSVDSAFAERSGVIGERAPSAREILSADREALDALLTQVGVLQANYQRLDVLSQRVAGLAGLPLAQLQIVPEKAYLNLSKTVADKALLARMGQQLRDFKSDFANQTEQFRLLDVVLTKRFATLARQPTAMPVGTLSQLSSSYGWRKHPFSAEPSVHEGLDFAAPSGTPILAAAGGVIRTAARQSGFGNLVEIDHGDGLLTRYAHAEVLLVKKGDVVSRGQMIARVGSTGLSTGPHLHFEVRQYDKSLDPRAYLTGSPLAPDLVRIDTIRLPKGAW